MNRSALAVLLVGGLLVCLGSTAAAPSGSAFPQQDIDTDDVLMSVAIANDGDAVWTIEYRTRLETEEDEQAFADLQTDVASDPDPYADRFRTRMNRTTADAENATGREMAITDVSVLAESRSLPQEYGVLTYHFRWSNFAAVESDRLLVGDAIGGLFLDEETSLLLSWPEGYNLVNATPSPSETRNGSVVYNGPIDFAGDEPRIEAAPASAVLDRSVPGWVPVVIAATLLGGGFLAYRRWKETGAAKTGSPEPREGTPDSDSDGDPGSEDATDEPLLSSEEQVVQLIESEGGRMKQQAVAEQLGWTDAKTSQVTKKLRERGDLEGFRLGRENVLSLPDDEPSPESDSE